MNHNKAILCAVFALSCSKDREKTKPIASENVISTDYGNLKNFAKIHESEYGTQITLGSGANQFYNLYSQPSTFAICLDAAPSTATPDSKLKAKLHLKISNDHEDYNNKITQKIKQNVSASAKSIFASGDINYIAKSLTDTIKNMKTDESDIEIIFEAKRTFSRVGLENLTIRPEVMSGVNTNPWIFYNRCGTGGVVSVVKEVSFIAKASCKKSDVFSSSDTLNEIESSLDIKLAAKDVFEVSGAFSIASNLSTLLKTLSKHGVHQCDWEIDAAGIPTQKSDSILIDTENLVRTAQKGLDLVMQSTYDEARIISAEIKPYYKIGSPEGFEEFFKRFAQELTQTESRIKDFQVSINERLEYITTVSRPNGVDVNDPYILDNIKAVKFAFERLEYNKENPLANRLYSEDKL